MIPIDRPFIYGLITGETIQDVQLDMPQLSWFNIPLELKTANLLWAVSTLRLLDPVTEKRDKIPRQPKTGEPLDVSDTHGWVDYETAASSGYPALGFLLTPGCGFVVIDLDKIDPTDELASHFAALHDDIYRNITSYSEYSQSGKGVHILVRANLAGGIRRGKVEIYGQKRYMITTGNILRDMAITPQQEGIDRLVSIFGGRLDPEKTDMPPTVKSEETPEELLIRIRRARNADKFNLLFSGDVSGYPSQSEADLALAEILAFYTSDHALAMEVFRRSALYRGNGEKKGFPNRDKYELEYLYNKTFYRAYTDKAREDQIRQEHIINGHAIAERIMAKPEPEVVLRDMNFDWPQGLLGEIAQYIYGTAQRPVKEVALAGAIVFMAGIAGRQYNVCGTGLNFYVVVVAPSGRGKEAASAGIDRLVAAIEYRNPQIQEYVGPGHIASGQGLVRAMNERPSMFSVQAEFGHTLRIMSDPRSNAAELRTRQVLLDLFSKSGKGRRLLSSAYSDTDKNTKVIESPNFCMLGDSSPDRFYKAVDVDIVNEGFLPRLLVLTYSGERVPQNPHADDQPPPQLIEKIGALLDTIGQLTNTNHFINIAIEPAANVILDEFNKECDEHINHPTVSQTIDVWNRAHIKALRLAALTAVGDDWHQPCIRVHHAAWAVGIIRGDVDNIEARFRHGEVGEGEITFEGSLTKIVREYIQMPVNKREKYGIPKALLTGAIVPYAYLRRRLVNLSEFRNDRRGFRLAIRSAVQDAVEAEILVEVPAPAQTTAGRPLGMCFVPGDQFPSE